MKPADKTQDPGVTLALLEQPKGDKTASNTSLRHLCLRNGIGFELSLDSDES